MIFAGRREVALDWVLQDSDGRNWNLLAISILEDDGGVLELLNRGQGIYVSLGVSAILSHEMICHGAVV